MKKIVLLKSNMAAVGGLEKYTHELAAAFAKRECDVTLLTTGTIEKRLPYQALSLCDTSKFSLRHHLRFDALANRWLEQNPRPHIVFGMERTSFQTHYRAGSGVHAVYLKKRALVEPLWKQLSFAINPLHRALQQLEKEMRFTAVEVRCQQLHSALDGTLLRASGFVIGRPNPFAAP